MCHCLVIYLVSSTDQIYHLAASRLGDKCDRSMTLGKLLDNNAVSHFYFLKPQYPILRFYAAVTFCLFVFFFLEKICVPPPPTFRRRATPLVLLVHIKQKLKCTSVIMHSPSYLSIRRLSLHPFESHSFCRPSRICIFDFLSKIA